MLFNKKDKHFNKLTPGQDERLAMLAEEAGEIVQMVGKILRHGYDSYHPTTKEFNQQRLKDELIDLKAVLAQKEPLLLQ